MTLQDTDFNAEKIRTSWYRARIKRLADIAIVCLLIPATIPIGIALSLLISTDGHTPFYWQKRIGLGGRHFYMLKLRTMVPNADRTLEQHLAANPDLRAEWDSKQKLRHDPRVTRLGAILRKTSLDELPQLYNVLIGDMSLVGPRPMMVSQRGLYPGQAYYRMRPGITGFWQVSDRNASSFAARAKFDTAYETQMSFGIDLVILVKTLGVVLRRTGC